MTRLRREVAIKVMPAPLRDPDRIARFQREARSWLRSIIPTSETSMEWMTATARGLVLALIEGPTLAGRIAAGRIPLEETLASPGRSSKRSSMPTTAA